MKNMSLIVILSLALGAVLGGSFIVLQTLPDNSRNTFARDGYVLAAETALAEDGSAASTTLAFSEGGVFKTGYPEGVSFTDAEGRKAQLADPTFIHYADGSLGTLGDAVLMNLDDLGSDFVNHYRISPGVLLENVGNAYRIDHINNPITMSSLIMKLPKDRLLIAAPELSVHMGDAEEREFDGYVEVSYIDGNVIKLAHENETIFTVSPECTVTANGTRIDLSRRIIGQADNPGMYLDQLVVYADDNIDISREANRSIFSFPSFELPDFNIIDGEDGGAGSDGAAGTAGEAGGAGEAGTAGEAGEAGEAGQAGTAGGSGSDGSNGAAGRTGSTVGGGGGSGGGNAGGGTGDQNTPNSADTSFVPKADITDFNIGAGNVSGRINIIDDRALLTGDMTLTLTNLNTGQPVGSPETVTEGSMEVEFDYPNLETGVKYLLTLSSDYTVNGLTFNKDLVYKVFSTDDLGLTLQKLPSGENSLSFRIKKENYSNAETATLHLTDTAGNLIGNYENIVLSSGGGSTDVTFAAGPEYNIDPNTEYIAELINIYLEGNTTIASLGDPISALTLKTSPTVPADGGVNVISNIRDGSFSFQATGFIDPDRGIRGYRYEIFELNGSKVASVEASGTETATLVVDEVNIFRNTEYKVRAVALFFDNEKIVETEGPKTVSFAINADPLPVVAFEDGVTITHEKITGNLIITEVENGARIIDGETLYVTVKDNLSRTEVRKAFPSGTYTHIGNVYTIPVDTYDWKSGQSTQGLLMGTDHYFIVEGKVSLGDANPPSNMVIGTVVKRTSNIVTMSATLSQASGGLENIINVNLKINPSGNSAEEYDMSTIERLEFRVYAGSDIDAPNLAPLTTGVINDTDTANDYASTLKTVYYDNTLGAVITEADLGIPKSAITNSTFILELSKGYDYTGYSENFVTFNGSNRIALTRNETAPSLENSNDAFDVTAVTKGNATEFGGTAVWDGFNGSTRLESYRRDVLNANTILGYTVWPSVSGFPVNKPTINSLTYTMYRLNTYDDTQPFQKDAAGVAAIGGTPLFSRTFSKTEIASVSGTRLPRLTVLFDDGTQPPAQPARVGSTDYFSVYLSDPSGTMRGEQYFFTLTAELNLGGANINFQFPEQQLAGAAVHSRRLDTPKQAFKFEFYPWLSTASDARIRHRNVDPDNILQDMGGGDRIRILQGVSGSIDTGRVGALTPNNGSGDFSVFAEESVLGGVNAAFTASGGMAYRAVTVSKRYNNSPATSENTIFTRYFDAAGVGTQNAFPSSGFSVSVDAVAGENRFEIALTGASLTQNVLSRIAAVDATVELLPSGITYTRRLPFDATTGKASLPYGYLPDGAIADATGGVDISVSLLYDEGVDGFAQAPSGASGSGMFAIQLYDPGNGTRGGYLVPRAGANETGARLSQSASAGGSLFALSDFSVNAAESSGSFKHQTLLEPFVGSTGAPHTEYRFGVTDKGLLGSDGNYITVKALAPVPVASSIHVGMTGYSAEVSLDGVAAGASAAVATLTLKNADQLPMPGTKIIYADLYDANKILIKQEAASVTVTNTASSSQQITLSEFGAYPDVLTENTAYLFQVWTYDTDGTTKLLLYDPELGVMSPFYGFHTIGAVNVGATSSVSFYPRGYNDRFVRLTYSLSQTLGFNMFYSIEVLSGSKAGTTYTNQQLLDMGILPSSAITANPTTIVNLVYDEGNTFWEAGAKYRITAVASSAQTHTGIPGLGGTLGEHSFDFTMPGLSRPSFSAAITPGYSGGVYSLAVNTLDMDADKVITGAGKYKLRIFDSATGEDKTPDAVKSYTYTADNMPGGEGYVTFTGLAESTQYTLRWYAVVDTANAGVTQDISTVGSVFGYDNKTYVIYETTVSTTDEHGIYVGRISASAGGAEKIKLTFAGSVNLADVKRIQYTITNPAGTGNLTGKVDFSPDAAGDMYTFELPPSVTDKGENTVTLRFYALDNSGGEVYIDQPVSIYYYK